MSLLTRFPWMSRVLLSIAALTVSLAGCEIAARLLLPPAQLVRITTANTLPDRPFGVPAEKTEIDIGEVAIFGPKGTRLAPNVTAAVPVGIRDQEVVTIETNSLGLRYDELGEKDRGERRILVLGDSVTMGVECHEHELYTRQAEQRVADRPGWIRFINGGVVSMDLSNTFYQLVELIEPVRPDVVVLQLYLNDALDASVFTVDVLPRWLTRSRFVLWIANRIDRWRHGMWTEVTAADIDLEAWAREFVPHQRRVYGDDWETFERMHPTSRDRAAKDYGLGWNPDAWSEMEKIVAAAAAVCAEHDVELAVMLSPVDLQVYGAAIDRVPQEHFETMCRRLDLRCLDLLPVLREHRQSRGAELFYDQCHLTPEGHGIVADELVGFLDRQGLLPEEDS
jgi:lysophospholipase L1-like esterase